jgi:hypothetical protein
MRPTPFAYGLALGLALFVGMVALSVFVGEVVL